MNSQPVVLRAENIHKSYQMGSTVPDVVRGVSLEIRKNEILAISGPSGAGKSTLLHILGLIDSPDKGSVYFGEVDAAKLTGRERSSYRNGKIGFVFQFYHLLKDLNAVENVCLPTMVRESYFSYDRAATEKRAKELLELVGLSERLSHRPSELSGGERQRVAIARALMNKPELLLCDEPTGNLDQTTAEEIVELLWDLRLESRAVVIVTHDEELARRADRAIRIVDGCVMDS